VPIDTVGHGKVYGQLAHEQPPGLAAPERFIDIRGRSREKTRR
jgi:hypothetical protein